MALSQLAIEVFCSYAHEDELYRQQLETHLSVLKRQGLISLWYDRQILPGAEWAKTIDAHLESASIILLLISADFIASNYCYSVEMKLALERHEDGKARVIPVVVRPCDWQQLPIASLQVLPPDAKPISVQISADEAWTQVTAGLRRVIEDLPFLSASAPRTALPPIWMIPYPRNPFFLGREALLTQISSQLQAGQATALSQPQAISGLGGVGKTQIAVEYAYRHSQEYRLVLWARAESVAILNASYAQLVAKLNLPEKESAEQEVIIQAVKTWLQDHRHWLLILDNADELGVLKDFLPPALGGHLLITTRAQATGRLAHRIEVETFSLEDGALFLLQRAALMIPEATLEQASIEDRQLALQISRELGGLPLALDQAGAFLEETGCSLVDYLRLFRHHRVDLLAERRGLVDDHPHPVATTWSLSFAQVEQKNPAATDLLRLCAFLAPDAIPEAIIIEGAPHLGPHLASVGTDSYLLNQSIEALRAYSLISREVSSEVGNLLSVHRLVQAVLQDAMDERSKREWAERAVCAINAAFPEVKDQNWSLCDLLLPHAQYGTSLIKEHDMAFSEAISLLHQTGLYLRERALYQEAEPLLMRALTIQEQQLGMEHPSTAISLNNLGLLYWSQGKYAEAEPLLVRALTIREQHLGTENLDTATSLNNLAMLRSSQGRYEEAEPLYQRALSIREQKLGAEHPSTAISLNNLGRLYRSRGKFVEAEQLYQRALAIDLKIYGLQHPSTALSLSNLGGLYWSQSRYEEAEPLLKQALEIREQVLGPTHPDTARSLRWLAFTHQQQQQETSEEQ